MLGNNCLIGVIEHLKCILRDHCLVKLLLSESLSMCDAFEFIIAYIPRCPLGLMLCSIATNLSQGNPTTWISPGISKFIYCCWNHHQEKGNQANQDALIDQLMNDMGLEKSYFKKCRNKEQWRSHIRYVRARKVSSFLAMVPTAINEFTDQVQGVFPLSCAHLSFTGFSVLASMPCTMEKHHITILLDAESTWELIKLVLE